LINEFGFSLREEPLGIYYIESSDCQVLVSLEHSKVYVSIGPIGNVREELLQSGTRGGRVNIKIVSGCLDPSYTVEKTPWNAKIDISKELALYADLIKKYCRKMIKGDFSEWPMIQECVKK
jgi:hypothetical protein